MAAVILLVLSLLVMIRYPRLVSFETGRVLCIGLALFLVLLKWTLRFTPNFHFIRNAGKSILETYLLFIVVLATAFYMIPHLNAVLYEVDRPASLINLTFFTIGNIMPVSDSGGYLSSIYSFLDYGVVHSVSIFRPLATLYMSVVFKLCGSDLFSFHLFNSVFFIVAISLVIYHVIRYMGMVVAFLSLLFLVGYFSGIHGYVSTEVPGGQLGLISFVCIMDGLFEKRVKKYYIGFFLLCLGMQIRRGDFFPHFSDHIIDMAV